MLKLTQRQLDALRKDAIEEGRDAERRESIQRSIDRSMARVRVYPPDAPVFTVMGNLASGSILLACDDGRSFYHYACITSLDEFRDGLKPGEAWMEYRLIGGGSGGSRVRLSDRAMVLAGTEFEAGR